MATLPMNPIMAMKQVEAAAAKLINLVKPIVATNMLNARRRLAPQDNGKDAEIIDAVNKLKSNAEAYYKLVQDGQLTAPAKHFAYTSVAPYIMNKSVDMSVAKPLMDLLGIVQEMNPENKDATLNNSANYLNKVKEALNEISSSANLALSSVKAPAPDAGQQQALSGRGEAKPAAQASLIDSVQKLIKVASKIEKKYRI
jgi:hypothetical protein